MHYLYYLLFFIVAVKYYFNMEPYRKWKEYILKFSISAKLNAT